MSNAKHTCRFTWILFIRNAPQRLQLSPVQTSEKLLGTIFTHLHLKIPWTCPHSDDLHSRAGHLCVRGPSAKWLHGSSGWLPPNSSSLFHLLCFMPWGIRERAESESCCGLSPGAFLWPLHPAGGLPLLPTQPFIPAAALAPGSLHRGWEAEGPAPGSCGEVSCKEKVSPTRDHLGWRRDQLLLQGRKTN